MIIRPHRMRRIDVTYWLLLLTHLSRSFTNERVIKIGIELTKVAVNIKLAVIDSDGSVAEW